MNIVSGNFLGFSTSASWGDSNSHNNHSDGNKKHNNSNDIADPSRDEVMDQSRGDQEGESRDEERMEGSRNNTKQINESAAHHDVSMFSTLTELLFNPFLDGYCKTPFCSDVDYLPPACPSGGLYTTPQHEARDYFSTSNKVNKPHHYDHHGSADEFGDINRSGSGASSAGVGSSSHRRKHRRPLALAVGYGDEWKDSEGRRVVITPSSSRRAHNNVPANHRGGSPYLPYRATGAHPSTPSAPSTCTCSGQASSNSLVSPENDNIELSPHQTKAILCKYCTNRLRELDIPASSSSSGPISRPSPPLV